MYKVLHRLEFGALYSYPSRNHKHSFFSRIAWFFNSFVLLFASLWSWSLMVHGVFFMALTSTVTHGFCLCSLLFLFVFLFFCLWSIKVDIEELCNQSQVESEILEDSRLSQTQGQWLNLLYFIYFIYFDLSLQGFSGPVQLNGIGTSGRRKQSWLIPKHSSQVRCFWLG